MIALDVPQERLWDPMGLVVSMLMYPVCIKPPLFPDGGNIKIQNMLKIRFLYCWVEDVSDQKNPLVGPVGIVLNTHMHSSCFLRFHLNSSSGDP